MQWLDPLKYAWRFCSAEQKVAADMGIPKMQTVGQQWHVPLGRQTTQQPQVQPPSPSGVRPPMQPQQPMANVRRPSVAAQVGMEHGGHDAVMANVRNMFAPPAQNVPQQLGKAAAVHSVGDPLPKDWNKTLNEPTKQNGGLRTDGREAWDSVKGYRRKGTDKDNFDRSWHTAKGKS
jgi:hypothetical protein